MYSYLQVNGLVSRNQSEFRPGDSTTNQLLYLVNELHKAFDGKDKREVRSVFLDISKAFDKVWHDGLIFKLKQNGICGNLINLFHSYLNNRMQRVVLNGTESEYKHIESGVPQGSVLGPLIFLIYINDLEKNIKSHVNFFADDTMLFSIVNNPEQTAREMNKDLQTINKWAEQWKLAFNPDVNKQATEIIFSCKKSNPNHPDLFLNGNKVTRLNQQKHLGLILEKGLTFKKHVTEKIVKAKKCLAMIKNYQWYFPLKPFLKCTKL